MQKYLLHLWSKCRWCSTFRRFSPKELKTLRLENPDLLRELSPPLEGDVKSSGRDRRWTIYGSRVEGVNIVGFDRGPSF